MTTWKSKCPSLVGAGSGWTPGEPCDQCGRRGYRRGHLLGGDQAYVVVSLHDPHVCPDMFAIEVLP